MFWRNRQSKLKYRVVEALSRDGKIVVYYPQRRGLFSWSFFHDTDTYGNPYSIYFYTKEAAADFIRGVINNSSPGKRRVVMEWRI